MKASILKNLKKWKFSEIPTPNSYDQKNYALIKLTLNGICSTDVLRSMQTGFYNYPIVPGHEMIGKVFNIKKNNKFKKGDRVAVYPLIQCNNCKYCKNKNPNLCDNYSFLGSRTNGGYAEYVLAPIRNLIKIPKEVSDRKAVFTEPLSVTLHSFNIAEKQFKPKNILILGLGPIGLLVALWAKSKGYKNVTGIDRNSNRFKIFKKIGYNKCINSNKANLNNLINTNEKFDTVFECSGSAILQEIGISITEKQGQFILLSNPNEDLLMKKNLYSKILRGEINFRGSWSSLISPYNEWEYSLKMMKKKSFDPSILISKKIKLSEIPDIIPKMYNKKFPFIKIVVN